MLKPQSPREKPCVGSVSACAWGPALLREAEATEAGVYGRISPAPVIASRPTFSGAPATTAGSSHPSSPRRARQRTRPLLLPTTRLRQGWARSAPHNPSTAPISLVSPSQRRPAPPRSAISWPGAATPPQRPPARAARACAAPRLMRNKGGPLRARLRRGRRSAAGGGGGAAAPGTAPAAPGRGRGNARPRERRPHGALRTRPRLRKKGG